MLDRIRFTFLAPSRLTSTIRSGAPWLDVLLVSLLIALLSVALMPDDIFIEPMENAVTRRGVPVEITSSPDVIARWGRGMGMLATLGTHPFIALSIAGLLTLLFVIIGRARTTFGELLSLSSHALLIPALGTLIALVIRAIGVLTRGDLAAGAFYGPDDAPNLWVATLVSIDPFIVWMLVMLVIGMHALAPALSRRRAMLVLIGGYLLLVVGSTAWLHPEFRGESGGVARFEGARASQVEETP